VKVVFDAELWLSDDRRTHVDDVHFPGQPGRALVTMELIDFA
jgi:hypothetical protein